MSERKSLYEELLHFELGQWSNSLNSLNRDLGRIARRFKNQRITLVIRNPDLADGDVVLSNDEPTGEEAIKAIRRAMRDALENGAPKEGE